MACVADPFDESEGIAEIFELWRSRGLVVPHAGGPVASLTTLPEAASLAARGEQLIVSAVAAIARGLLVSSSAATRDVA